MSDAYIESMLATTRRKEAVRLLVPLFFLSGATSLVYETLWGRALHLVFGTSQVAIGTVLAAFMAGLALGGYLMSRYVDQIKKPLLAYGLLEGGIGIYALVFPLLLQLATPVYLGFWRWLEPSPTLFAAFQAILVGILLLIPTTCMGATLPLLARFTLLRVDQSGDRVGLLYGVNTLGAVFGTFMAGFMLLPALGLQLTTFVAVGGNLLLFVGSVLLSRFAERGSSPLVEESPEEPPPTASYRAILVVAGLAGLAALTYEMAWFRLMSLQLGGSVYSFSLMLLAFLIGIALGGWAGGPISDRLFGRWGRTGVLIGLCSAQVAVALLSYTMMWGYDQLPYIFVRLFTLVEDYPEYFFPSQLLLAGLVMTPPALFMGATFPLAVRAVLSDPNRIGAPIGQVYSVNTVGGIFGALFASFLFLPNIRMTGTILVGISINLIAALIALGAAWVVAGRVRRHAFGLGAVGILSVFVVSLVARPPWYPLLMSAGMFHYVTELKERTHQAIFDYAVSSYDLFYYREGLSSVVVVAKNQNSDNVWLANNGKVDASSTVDMPTQVLVAHLPFLFGRSMRSACVIGLASGVTVGAATLHPELERIDLVELEPAIFEASHFFDTWNHRPLEDKRLVAIANDGRNHILLAPEQSYDVVISEPSNPWLTGVSNLFTKEFFEEGKKRLRPGGIWSQWVQMYGMGTEELRALLKTYAEVFPYIVVFATIEDADLVVLGSDQPLDLDLDRIQQALESDPRVRAEMALVDIEDAYDVITRFQLDRKALESLTAGAPLNTDDNMLIEFDAPKRLHQETSEQNYLVLLSEAVTPLHTVDTYEEMMNLARAYGKNENWVRALIVLKEAARIAPGDPDVENLTVVYRNNLLEELAEGDDD